MNTKNKLNKKRYVILGKLPTKYYCPYFEDPDCCIISMNLHDDCYLLPRIDYWFDLHQTPEIQADYTKDNFPFEECHKLVGRRFYSTMAYMIAFAVLKGADEICIYGCRFTPDGNSRRERELHNVREMLFYCLGRGIKITICDEDIDYLFPEHIPDDGMDFDQ